MRRRRIYLLLALLLLAAAGLRGYDFYQAEAVKEGTLKGEKPADWYEAIAASINAKSIRLMVDGKELACREDPMYMTADMELMMPVSMVTKAFSCAVNYYDNSILIMEKGSIHIELLLGEKKMTVNGVAMELSTPFTNRYGSLYIPVEAVEKGLGYAIEWSVEDNTVKMSALNPDMPGLPRFYDYRLAGRAPQVKNQGSLGTCWSFASLMALESSLMPEEPYDFSEDHMSLRNSFGLDQNDGGEYTMSMAYLTAWQGPVLEKDDPYGDGVSPEGLSAVKHVQEIQILPSKDYEKIKEAVYLYGGVQSSLYTSLKNYKSRSIYYNRDAFAYCYIGTEKPNHDVVIVGWDDNYPKENFNMNLEGDGAFICVNSWGEAFGDEGYFYVSYYDTNIGIHNILYTRIEDPDNYDTIYQSDLCGWIGQLGYGKESAYFANVYQTSGEEMLEAVGFYATGPNTEYQVFAARDVEDAQDLNNKELVAQGKLSNAGFYTIPLDKAIRLKDGERYGVIVKITTPGSVHPIAIEYQVEGSLTQVDLSDGEGYISLRGTTWESAERKQGCNLCLKAYTKNVRNGLSELLDSEKNRGIKE